MEYVPGEKCSADYAADITVVGETLEVGVYVARTGTVPSPTADIAVDCDSIGVPRVLEVDLENPFQGSAWRDLAGTVHPFETPAPTLPEPPTASPTALSFDEDDLIADYSRRLAGPHCDRRRPLPANVLLGIECADEVDRWVIHVYATEEPARDAYVRRLGLDNVALETGDCVANVPGDTAWAGPPHSADAPWRAGCFVDEEGLLNGRVTCPHLTDPEEWLYDAAMYIGFTTSNPNFDGNLQLAYDSLWLGTGNRELALTEPYLGVVPPRICYEYFPGFPYDEDIEPAP
jgi:hypothetical protein